MKKQKEIILYVEDRGLPKNKPGAGDRSTKRRNTSSARVPANARTQNRV
ncbi:MAG: hypothetical protein LBQ88_10720 [Treponema sp.]|nr:hypothetical protein [Treponema sp.]